MSDSSHTHEWKPDPARWHRLHGDVYEDPVACACGATAWTHTWGGKCNYTDVVEPPGTDLSFALYQTNAPVWIEVTDGDPRAAALYRRHYSGRLFGRKRSQSLRFAGPGEKMVLMTPDCQSLFVWRLFIESQQTEPRGVNCAVFRREQGSWLASDMILAAEELARERWPGQRLYTYVAPWEVKSANPGYCFLMAGWKRARTTGRRLIELEKV